MYNRKGKLILEESVKWILAVACIAFLISLSVTLYGVFNSKAKIEQGRATLDEFVSKVNFLEGDKISKMILGSPKGWYVVFYDSSRVLSGDGTGMPIQCGNKDCVCLCEAERRLSMEERDYFYYRNKGKSDGLIHCEKEGICKSTKNKILFGEDMLPWLSLHEAPIGIEIKWNEDKSYILVKRESGA